jgi:hypothetical protein
MAITPPVKPPTAAEIARQQESVARAKRNEAGGKTSHADRVKSRNEAVQKQNAASAKAHPAEAKRSGDALFRRTGTGSVADRLTRRDMPAKGKPAPGRPSDRVGKSDDIDPDAVAAYNKEPVDHAKIDESKPEGSRGWDEKKHRRHSKGGADGGKFA